MQFVQRRFGMLLSFGLIVTRHSDLDKNGLANSVITSNHNVCGSKPTLLQSPRLQLGLKVLNFAAQKY